MASVRKTDELKDIPLEDMNPLKQICVLMPPRYIRDLKRLVKMGLYPSMAEAIRIAVRDLLTYHGLWRHNDRKEV